MVCDCGLLELGYVSKFANRHAILGLAQSADKVITASLPYYLEAVRTKFFFAID